MPVPKVLSQLSLRNFVPGKREKDLADVQRDLEREILEAEIARHVEDSTAKELVQWEAVYGGHNPPHSHSSRPRLNSLLIRRRGSRNNLCDRALSQPVTDNNFAIVQEEDEKLKICGSVAIRDISIVECLETNDDDGAANTACIVDKMPAADVIQPTNSRSTFRPEQPSPNSRPLPKIWSPTLGQYYFPSNLPHQPQYDSPDGKVSMASISDECVDEARKAHLNDAFSPWSSRMSYAWYPEPAEAHDSLHEPATTRSKEIEHDKDSRVDFEDEIIIREDDPERLESKKEQTQSLQLPADMALPVEIWEELHDRDIVPGEKKACRTEEWAQNIQSAELPILVEECSERCSTPGVSVQQVLPELFSDSESPMQRGQKEEEVHLLDQKSCQREPVFNRPLNSCATQNAHMPPQAVRSVSTSVFRGQQTPSKLKRRGASLPVLDTTLMGQRKTILASRGTTLALAPMLDEVESHKGSSTSSATTDVENMSLRSRRSVLETHVDPNDMTLSQRREMLLKRRRSEVSTSPISPQYDVQGAKVVSVSKRVSFSSALDTGTRRKPSQEDREKTEVQRIRFMHWRHSLVTVPRLPDFHEVRIEHMMQMKQVELDKAHRAHRRRQSEVAARDQIMLHRPFEAEELHRQGMRKMQRDAYLHS